MNDASSALSETLGLSHSAKGAGFGGLVAGASREGVERVTAVVDSRREGGGQFLL